MAVRVLLVLLAVAAIQRDEAPVKKDVPFVATPRPVVEQMLKMAKVSADDLVYDLGSGDGRIVITAAQKYRARGVGVDIDPQRIREAEQNARQAGVTDRVRFIQGDLFETNLHPATVVTLYLLPSVNVRLRPKLLAQLRPGTPVVSHEFDMGEWEADQFIVFQGSEIHLWIVPARVEGTWRWKLPNEKQARVVRLTQKFQRLEGSGLTETAIRGEEILFTIRGKGGSRHRYYGRVNGDTIKGRVEINGRRHDWTARRQ